MLMQTRKQFRGKWPLKTYRTLGDEIAASGGALLKAFDKLRELFCSFPHNRRNLHYVDRLCHVGRRGRMYFWDKNLGTKGGTIHATSAKANVCPDKG